MKKKWGGGNVILAHILEWINAGLISNMCHSFNIICRFNIYRCFNIIRSFNIQHSLNMYRNFKQYNNLLQLYKIKYTTKRYGNKIKNMENKNLLQVPR